MSLSENILLPHVFAYGVGRVCGVSSILKLIASNAEISIRLKINIKAKMTKLARGSLKNDLVLEVAHRSLTMSPTAHRTGAHTSQNG